jgi:hypothetical protein
MQPKIKQSRPEECKDCENRKSESYCWSTEKLVDTLMNNHYRAEKNWVETGLPQLVEDIMKNYQTIGGMDHLEGTDLPSKKIVIEVLEDLVTLLFPDTSGRQK